MHSCINPRDWQEAEEYLKRFKVVVLDNFFTQEMCNTLHHRMISATVFKDYWEDYQALAYDLSDPVTYKIVKDLEEACPTLLSNFQYSWSFVYNNEALGVGLHADPSNFNVNVWVTPDSCVKDENLNGLKIYNVDVPSEATREQYNLNVDNYLTKIVNKNPHIIYRIPYRCNRAIIFDASCPHETDSVSMILGKENRRVSYTMLYGEGPFK